MDQSAVFLAGSVLMAIGIIVLVGMLVIINNILHKYWKPVKLFTNDSFAVFGGNPRYMTDEEYAKLQDAKQEPALDKRK